MIAGEPHTGEELVGEFSKLVKNSDHLGLGVGEAAQPGSENLDVKLSDETRTGPGLNLGALGASVVRLVLVEDSHPVSSEGGVGVAESRHIFLFLLELLVLDPGQHGEGLPLDVRTGPGQGGGVHVQRTSQLGVETKLERKSENISSEENNRLPGRG